MEARQRLEVLKARECDLRTRLQALECDLRAQLQETEVAKQQCLYEIYGAFTYFSVLPLELIFKIVDYVLEDALKSQSTPSLDPYNLFLTCRDAFELRSAWADYLYVRIGGGISKDYRPPLSQFNKCVTVLFSRYYNSWDLLVLGIDPFKANKHDFGVFKSGLPIDCKGYTPLPLKLRCAEFTRQVLRFPGHHSLMCVLKYQLVDTIPWEEWMARVEQESHYSLRQLYIFAQKIRDMRTFVQLCETENGWYLVMEFAYETDGPMDELLGWAKPGWSIPSWFLEPTPGYMDDKPQPRTVIFHASDALLRHGEVIRRLTCQHNIARTLTADWKYKKKHGTSRLVGLIDLMGQKVDIEHWTFATPEEALDLKKHIESFGGRVNWLLCR